MDDNYSIGITAETQGFDKAVDRLYLKLGRVGKDTKGLQQYGKAMDSLQLQFRKLGVVADKPHLRMTSALIESQKAADKMRQSALAAAKAVNTLNSNAAKPQKAVSEVSTLTDGYRKLSQEAKKAQQTLAKLGLSAQTGDLVGGFDVKDLTKNLKFADYEKMQKRIEAGWKVSNAQVDAQIKRVSQLLSLHHHLHTSAAGYNNSLLQVSKVHGSGIANKLTQEGVQESLSNELHRLHNLKDHLDAEASRKELDRWHAAQTKKAQAEAAAQQKLYAQREAHERKLEASRARSVAASVTDGRLNDIYRERIRLLKQQFDTEGRLNGNQLKQLDSLRKIEQEYHRIALYKQGLDRDTALKSFSSKHGSFAATPEASSIRQGLLHGFAAKSVEPAVTGMGRLTELTGKLKTDSKYLHDTWRGIAASTGNLWLSWGNFAGMAAGLALGASVFQSLKVDREFGWEMAQVGVASDASQKAVASLTADVLKLNQAGSLQGPIQMAQGLRMLAQAGLEAEEALENLPTVLNFALVAGVSDGESAQFLAGLRSAFNLTTKEALQAGADQTAKAANVSQTSIEAMSQALKQASPAAARFGLSVTDVSAALAVLAKFNIEGSAAGTAFRNMLTDLAGRTEKSSKALNALGLTLYNTHGMAKPFTQVVAELREKLSGLTQQEQQKWLKSIFDERGAKAAGVLLSEAGKDFERMHREIQRSGENMGYTSAAALRLADTSEGAFRRMKNSWEGMFASVGNQSSTPFKALMGSLTDLANNESVRTFASNLTQAFLTLAKAGVGVANALAPIAPLLGGMAAAAGVFGTLSLTAKLAGMAKAALLASSAMSALKMSMVAASVASGLSGGGMAGALAATRVAAVGLVTALGPIGIAAVAAGAAITYAMLSAKSEVLDLSAEISKLDKRLLSVDVDKYTDFNEFGWGKKIDVQLGLGYRPDDKSRVLDNSADTEHFLSNLEKIKAAVSDAQQRVREEGGKSSETLIEQELMLTERKKSLLQDQLAKFDQATAHIETLSRQDKNIREQLEVDLLNTMKDLTDQRVNYAIKKMRDLAAEAAKSRGFLDDLMDYNGSGNNFAERINLKRRLGQKLNADELSFESYVGLGESPAAAYARVNPKVSTDALVRFHNLLNSKDGREQIEQQAKTPEGQMYLQEVMNRSKSVMAKYNENKEMERKAGMEGLTRNNRLLAEVNTVNLEQFKAAFDTSTRLALILARQSKATQAEAKKVIGTRTTGGVDPDHDSPTLPESGRGRSGSRTSVTQKYFTPYETPNLLTKDALEVEKEHLNKLNERLSLSKQMRLEVDEGMFKAVEESKAKIELLKLDKERLEYVKEYNKLSKGLAEGKYAPPDVAKVQADMERLKSEILRRSTKGQVEIGSTYKATIRKLSGNGGAVDSRVAAAADFLTTKATVTAKDGSKRLVAAADNFMGKCAEAVNSALRSQGFKVQGHGFATASQLLKNNKGWTQLSEQGYVPQKGDVVSWSPTKGHPYGHTTMYDGANWWSDVNQSKTKAAGNYLGMSYKGALADGSRPTIVRYKGSGAGSVASTEEYTTWDATKVTANNASEGDLLAAAKARLEVNRQDLELKAQAQNFLTVGYETEKKNLEFARQNLELGNKRYLIDNTNALVEGQALELKALQLEHQKRLAEINSEDKATQEEKALSIAKQTENYQIQLGILKQKQEVERGGLYQGAADAVREMEKRGNDFTGLASNSLMTMADGVGEAFSRMALEGKQSFSDMAASVLKDIGRMIIKMTVMNLLARTFGAMFPTTTATGVSGTSVPSPLLTQAAGGAFEAGGRLTAYASGGVVTTPTRFGYSGGLGLMGENGPEGILPLTRMPNGDLGVQMLGAQGGGTVVNAPVTVTVSIDSNGREDSQVDANDARSLGEAVRAAVVDKVMDMLRPGEPIHQAIRSGGAA